MHVKVLRIKVLLIKLNDLKKFNYRIYLLIKAAVKNENLSFITKLIHITPCIIESNL